MAEGRRPRGRVLLLLSLLLAAALAWSGCAGSPPSPGDGGSDGSDEDADDGDPLGPYSGMVSGVDTVALTETGVSGVTGFVYDVTTGEGISGVLVAVECGLGSFGPEGASRILVTGPDGAFALADAPELAPCAGLTYEVDAAGYRLVVPLESGPLVEGVSYVVKAGMVADLP